MCACVCACIRVCVRACTRVYMNVCCVCVCACVSCLMLLYPYCPLVLYTLTYTSTTIAQCALISHTSHESRVQYRQLHCDVCLQNDACTLYTYRSVLCQQSELASHHSKGHIVLNHSMLCYKLIPDCIFPHQSCWLAPVATPC